MNHRAMKLMIFLLVSGAFLGGCGATTLIDEFRVSTSSIDIEDAEKIVILGRHDAGHYETDLSFVECVGERIDNHVLVMPELDFINALYPWFEPRTAPKSLKRLKRLLEEPMVKAKIEQENVRYMVFLDGDIETDGHAGSMSCTISPAGGGCFGMTSWEKTAFFEAIIWDMEELAEEARIRVDSEGTSYVIGVIAPIPLLTPVEKEACNGLGDQLNSYFSETG